MTTIEAAPTTDTELLARAIDRLAQAVEQAVLNYVDVHTQKTAQDPYPAGLEPAAEFGDLPPVQPVPQTNGVSLCPIHNTPWKTVPAGVSKKTGKAYESFRACSTPGCDQRPPR
jgi:hypothetical protein